MQVVPLLDQDLLHDVLGVLLDGLDHGGRLVPRPEVVELANSTSHPFFYFGVASSRGHRVVAYPAYPLVRLEDVEVLADQYKSPLTADCLITFKIRQI